MINVNPTQTVPRDQSTDDVDILLDKYIKQNTSKTKLPRKQTIIVIVDSFLIWSSGIFKPVQ